MAIQTIEMHFNNVNHIGLTLDESSSASDPNHIVALRIQHPSKASSLAGVVAIQG